MGAACGAGWFPPTYRCTAAARSSSTTSCSNAVARLEPRWEAELAGIEFAVQEVPDEEIVGEEIVPVPLARIDPGEADPLDAAGARSPRIVLYRRPLLARAEDEDELSELIFDVVVEEFAELLGLDPDTIDPGYAEGD